MNTKLSIFINIGIKNTTDFHDSSNNPLQLAFYFYSSKTMTV